jgi:BirA family biotin operon repressor/biotin-[acetyl-CoA-carboxylase] ligase
MAPEGLGARLRARGCRWGDFLLVIRDTDSTNRLAAALARRGAPHGSLVVAETQTAGRGRWTRRWESPPGGLYLSVVLRPRAEENVLPSHFPIVAAVAAAEALERAASVVVRLSWPNDLYVGRRKVGGILSESSFSGTRLDFAVVGIGINVNQTAADFAPEVASRATSLRDVLGRHVDPVDVTVELVSGLESWWEHPQGAGLLERWSELAAGAEGSSVRVVSREGDAFEAVTEGLAPDGGLRVRLADGTTRILYSDDVHLLDEYRSSWSVPRESVAKVEPAARATVQNSAERVGTARVMTEDSYYAEVERYFVERRGSPLFITPGEWQLVFEWERLGIPLDVVKKGIDRVFERPQALLKRRKLGYCRQTVAAAFRRFREAGVGSESGAADGDEATSIASYIGELAASLRSLSLEWRSGNESFSRALGELAAGVESLADSPSGDVEAVLGDCDSRLLDAAEAAAGGDVVEELTRDAEASLASYRERMPEKIYRAAVVSAYRRRLRKKLGLPTLSLYLR